MLKCNTKNSLFVTHPGVWGCSGGLGFEQTGISSNIGFYNQKKLIEVGGLKKDD